MNLLAIETSCDETAAAVVVETGDPARPWNVLSNIVASQTAIHRGWGGVVPELASRQHVRDICGVVEAALEGARIGMADLGAVAVTQGPGLVGSLLVGVSFAKTLGWARNLPVVPVHHLAGHIESLTLAHGELPLPAAILVVSGGHTSLYHVPAAGTYQLIGRTRDDAAGEAYDKVAKLLGLGYPGGPAVDRLAPEGRDDAYAFPVTRLTHADRNAPDQTAPPGLLPPDAARRVDFSFSGLKTAVLNTVRKETANNLCEQVRADIALAFVEAIVDVLAAKSLRALEETGLTTLVVAGGVSANVQLRERLKREAEARSTQVFFPPVDLCTDNGAMIALAGFAKMQRASESQASKSPLAFSVHPRWSLEDATS